MPRLYSVLRIISATRHTQRNEEDCIALMEYAFPPLLIYYTHFYTTIHCVCTYIFSRSESTIKSAINSVHYIYSAIPARPHAALTEQAKITVIFWNRNGGKCVLVP